LLLLLVFIFCLGSNILEVCAIGFGMHGLPCMVMGRDCQYNSRASASPLMMMMQIRGDGSLAMTRKYCLS